MFNANINHLLSTYEQQYKKNIFSLLTYEVKKWLKYDALKVFWQNNFARIAQINIVLLIVG